MARLTTTLSVDAAELTTREINQILRRLADEGHEAVTVHNPAARHNLGVALSGAMEVTFAGSVGYYCGSLGTREPRVLVQGNAGWRPGRT